MTESAEAFKPAVLHINLARGWRGGEQQTWLLMKELARAGYRQGLCAYPDSPLAQAAKNLENLMIFSPGRCLRGPWALGDWDVAHAHEGRGVYLAWWISKIRALPYVITRRMQHAPKSRLLTRAVYRDAEALVGISTAACQALQRFLPGSGVERIPSVHAGETAATAAVKEIRTCYKGATDSILVGHAGALVDAHKGQSLLIDACSELRREGYPIVLVLMGEGPDREEFATLSAGRPWIHMPGEVAPINAYLRAMDIFAFPSRHEGLGSVLLEAMAAHIPIAAADVGGIPDIVRHNETGLLFPPNNAQALREAIHTLIIHPCKAQALAQRAASAVALDFSAERMAAKYRGIYVHCARRGIGF
jgi:glycosyltransferase involved in cell wall biosynthesis